MPAKGKHRRPKSQRFTRSIAAAGTGGAALVLPLIGATGAHAAPVDSVSQKSTGVSQESVTEESVTEKREKAAAKKAAKKAGKRTYSVKRGDYLAKIAREQGVTGGWKRIYSDNREVIGSDPSLIRPGLKLTLCGKAPSDGGTSRRDTRGGGTAGSDSGRRPGPSPRRPRRPRRPRPRRPRHRRPRHRRPRHRRRSAGAEAAPSTTQAAETSGSGLTLPVAGATVSTAYKTAGSMWSSGYHTGVDFVVPTGTSLKAVGAGTVVSAGWGGAYGNQVVIQLADGHYAQYAHLSSLSVSAGQNVSAGQQIGLSGATGNVTGPHLHFEIRTGPEYGSDVDPMAYLRLKGVGI